MPEKSILEKALDTYLANLQVVLPMLAAIIIAAVLSVIAFAILALALFPLRIHAPFTAAYLLFGTIGVFGAVALLITWAVGSVAMGVTADMALEAVAGGKPDVGRSFEKAKQRLVDLLLVGLVTGVVAGLIALAIPVGGWVVSGLVASLLLPAPLMVMKGSQWGEAIGKAVELMLNALGKRAEVPLVIILLGILSSYTGLGALIFLFGIPYALVLLAHYTREGQPG